MKSLDGLVKALKSTGSTFSLAESCTGGLIGSIITEMPGSSDYFLGSAVTYSNYSKNRLIGVSQETLNEYGAVSEQTALEMAEGSLDVFNADFAASVTGVAGPGGGTEKKPVGTVCIGLTNGRRSMTFTKHFKGDRSEIRSSAADAVFELLADFILEKI
ncbi:MAG: CinA family protein [Candidatus Methanomethylophilaceae archaeon]